MKRVVLISGKMRTGKNTLSDFISAEFINKGFTVRQDAFANTLKSYCSEDFKDLEKKLNHYCAEVIGNLGVLYDLDKHSEMRTQYISVINLINSIKTTTENWYEDKNIITRSILQTVGTNLIRDRVDKDFWVKKFVERVHTDIRTMTEEYWLSKGDIVLCSDVRFPNEIELVHSLLPDDKVISIKVERNTGIVDTHLSETALDGYGCFDFVVENNGTLEEFKSSTPTIVEEIIKNY